MFGAEWMVVSEELWFFTSCLLRLMSRNSVLEEFSVRRFTVVHEEIRFRTFWRWFMLESKWVGRKEERAKCHLRRGDGLGNKRKWKYWVEWCTWRRIKGPKTEPWGTSHEDMCQEERLLLLSIVKTCGHIITACKNFRSLSCDIVDVLYSWLYC